ncbi:CoA-binding protein [Thermodesulfobacteriota bacterium]
MKKKHIEQIATLYHPSSLAIFGASDDSSKLGYELVRGFVEMGYPGQLYPINPSGSKSIMGLPAYRNLKDIRKEVVLALITTPPHTIAEIIKDCVEKGVKGIIVFSAPSGELDSSLLDAIRLAKSSGTRILGPNSIGLHCPSSGLAFYTGYAKKSAPISFIAHSTSMASLFIASIVERGLGCHKAVVMGSEWDLTWTDFLEYLGQDDEIEIIAGYLEGIRDGNRFLEIARTISTKKPFFIVKGGVSEAGAVFTQSHTGSMAGSQRIWEAVLKQANVIGTKDIRDMVDHVLLFKYLKDRRVGPRIGIVTGVGGLTVNTVDFCEKHKLQIPELSPATKNAVKALIPPYGTSFRNPIDVSVAAERNLSLYTRPIQILDHSDDVDVVVCVHEGDFRGDELAEEIVNKNLNSKKPLVVILMGASPQNTRGIKILLEAGIPAFSESRNAIKALASLIRWKERLP